MTDPFLTLFVPADRPERYGKAARAGADAIIIDLEDAVAAHAKDEARRILAESLPGAGVSGSVFVRVNASGTPFFEADLAAVSNLPLAGIVLPKAEDAGAIEQLRERLPGREIHALLESARGIGEARAIARVADRLLFGSLDFAHSIGADHTRETLLLARSEVVLAAALAGRPAPLDGVTTRIDDAALIAEDAAYAKSLGFGGKILIHPRQIEPAIRGFAPRPEKIDEARAIVAASGGEAVKHEGQMIDVPVVEAARRLIARHERAATRLVELGAGR